MGEKYSWLVSNTLCDSGSARPLTPLSTLALVLVLSPLTLVSVLELALVLVMSLLTLVLVLALAFALSPLACVCGVWRVRLMASKGGYGKS